jgi:SH3-like domain-containing protein
VRRALRAVLRSGTAVAAAVACGTALAGQALEFRSVAEDGAVLYDAPSTRSKRLFVLSRQYPLEVIVSVEGFAKVRDAGGELAWIESRQLSTQRTVVVRAATADVRQSADDAAAVVFRVEREVVLELLEPGPGPWARVRHRDGQTGFVRTAAVWGM